MVHRFIHCLPLAAALLVAVPVFLQAPWVRTAPMQAGSVHHPPAGAGHPAGTSEQKVWQPLGALLVGFCGSWLAGTLFWGWCRLHPLWHLPIEAFALPLAVAGLGGRWRWAGAFYLAALLGTAATDAVMAVTGLMDLWPRSSRPAQRGPPAAAGRRQRGAAALASDGVALAAVCSW